MAVRLRLGTRSGLLAHAFMKRAGLPVTLLSGVGAQLGDALISAPEIGALAFVGEVHAVQGGVTRRLGIIRRGRTSDARRDDEPEHNDSESA